MRRSVLAANWKMNGSLAANADWVRDAMNFMIANTHFDWVIFPPYLYLPQLASALAGHPHIHWGAQNVSHWDKGTYTGEISVSMLQDLKCRYVLIGHSERRHLMNENDDLVAKKFLRVKEAGLIPVLCVGETLEERKSELTNSVIKRQIDAILHLGKATDLFINTIVAYEPVWAIGTGEAATPDQAQEVHQSLRNLFASHDDNVAAKLPILYGGSVKPDNAHALFSKPDIDGGLIGGASLIAKDFMDIGKCIK